MFHVERDSRNPLLGPNSDIPWLAEAAFNPSPVMYDGMLHLVFRAAGHPALFEGETLELSSVAVARQTTEGIFEEPYQLITPSEDFDRYGCEDPRVTKIGNVFYIFYTALSGYPFTADNIKVAVAISKDLKTIDEKHLVTPFNAKAMALFPERVEGKFRVILTVNSDSPPAHLAIAEFTHIEQLWDHDRWRAWYNQLNEHTLNLTRLESDHVEVGAPPLWTKAGWLLIYAHIQNYFTDQKVFGIEAVLLKLNDPTQVISRTVYPFMVPEESYERYGRLSRIIFPSGVMRHGDTLRVYYGATDTTCCRASLSFQSLMESLSADGQIKQHAERSPKNPLLLPIPDHAWEASHVLNPAALEIEGQIYVLYRAVGANNTSVIGLARTTNGTTFVERLDKPIYVPRAPFESKAGGPNDNSGCEDARAVRIGDRIYITYTAYDSVSHPKVAESSISVADFLARNFEAWTYPEIITPQGVDDKDACLFPEKISGKYMILHRVSSHICADFVDTLDFRREKITRCIQMIGPRTGMWDGLKVGIAGPPMKTRYGWVLLYHGVTETHEYCLGAILLDRKDPTKIIGRTAQPIMTPVLDWERNGWISNVVFPCGQVVRDGVCYLYYGGADHVIGLATIEIDELAKSLRPVL